MTVHIIVAVVVVALVLITVTGFVIYKKRKAPENSTELSAKLDPELRLSDTLIPPSELPLLLSLSCCRIMLLLLCISDFFIWRRSNNGFRPANISDSTSETSLQPLTDHSRFFIMSATLCRYCVQSPTAPESNVLT
ncbi:major histocompatibility complex class I-related gene protein-like isoform X1 [Lates japonicus]|uniref:Major histocompatibility complex class I-related gene protein-like isoform X1 n=1 Tax=Lates japonicus TaxID=270547 RepID=A0AAD3NDF3_LATJO|nr:major histocompatibility complex class I-related gene protein-like isoform X1 [Lates japonicus]